MPKTHCGTQNVPPRPKRFGTENECRKQLRLYGKYMMTDYNEKLANTLLAYTTSDDDGVYCGYKDIHAKHGRMAACTHQLRRYGLFPYILYESDIEFVTLYLDANDTFPGKMNTDHEYTNNIYNKNIANKKKVLQVVALSKNLTTSQKTEAINNIFTNRGVVGYAFGYFSGSVFQIVRIHVNIPYRSTKKEAEENKSTFIASWLLNGLVRAVKENKTRESVTMQIDSEAPCFRLFNSQYAQNNNRLKKMYEESGFRIISILGNDRSKERTAILKV